MLIQVNNQTIEVKDRIVGKIKLNRDGEIYELVDIDGVIIYEMVVTHADPS